MTVAVRTRSRPGAGVRPALPVFFDPAGRRWRRIRASVVIGILAVATAVAGFTVLAARPLWPVLAHRASGYPAQLLSQRGLGAVPVIGGEGNDALVRVDLVQRRSGTVFLSDPFSGQVLRAATADEVKKIGSWPYALEWYGHPADRQLVLTFDDGPDPRNTPAILDILAREHVPATFFVVGQNAVRDPGVVGQEIRQGNVVGNHTLSHSGLGHGDVLDRADLVGADRVIRATAGYGTRLFRIPYGDPDDNLLAVLRAQQLGYTVVDYDVDTRDWQYRAGQAVPLPGLDGNGHVVLMHDGGADRTATVRLLPRLIAQAKTAGYTFTTAASLVPAAAAPAAAAPGAADYFTRYAAWTAVVLPASLIGWLFWAGAGSLAVMSLLYITLALVNWRRQRRPCWAPPPAGEIWVTVALPCYNEEKVVAKTLAALARTRYGRFEVIAVDDGSTDDTWGVLTAFASVWPQLRVFRQPRNQGKAAALNLAIARARGWIVVTMDGDTVFEPQTIGNGVEGEPASDKDKVLLSRAPHLVIDGAVSAAELTGATEAVIVAHLAAYQAVQDAARERRAAGCDQVPVRVLAAADRFTAGEASAVLGWTERGAPVPTGRPPRLGRFGHQPALVQNVETLAHLALIMRHGASWFRSAGTPAEPGTMLVTLLGAVRHPGVYEVEPGVPVSDLLDLAGGTAPPPSALLIGGYFGTWVASADVLDRPFSAAGLSPLGTRPGAGIVGALPSGACGLAETARLTRYLAGSSAGQCGPCVFGLDAIARELERAVAGGGDLIRVRGWLRDVTGRGACHHPDGTALMVGSALRAFRDEIGLHRRGRCSGTASAGVFPVPEQPS